MKSAFVETLKQEVEKTFGRKILSSNDCRNLCDDIQHHLKLKISFNTLRRFFNLMETESQPSYYTLDVLSTYCGFSSFSEFIASKEQTPSLHEEKENPGLLNYLVVLFKNTEVNNAVDITYFNLIQQTIGFLGHHPQVLDKFQREIAKTKNGQEYYFEHFVNLDKLNSFYGKGLHYYVTEKNTAEAKIFAHSLYCIRDFLSLNDEGVKQHYKAVMQYSLNKSLRPDIHARFFATQLIYAFATGKDPEPILIKARQVYDAVSESRSFWLHVYFEFILAFALILTHQYEEAFFYVDEYLKYRSRSIQSIMDMQYCETFKLFQAIILANTGKVSKAREVLKEIDINKFYFLSKQSMTLLYLNLSRNLNKKTADEEQINFLSQSTGFKKLAGSMHYAYS